MSNNTGYFGEFGGRYVSPALVEPLRELEKAFRECWADDAYQQELAGLRKNFVGRPTPLFFAERLSEHLASGDNGASIYLKLEGLANSGAHKINNVIGQALVAKRLGKTRIIAETGAGQHGVATAVACALLGLQAVIYMGTTDMYRQQPNVLRMRLFGAEVRGVDSGSRTLKDAVNAALRDWTESYPASHYLLGSALGPSPYPHIVATLQAIIGQETAAECRERGITPHVCIACAGGGSNALGFFAPWVDGKEPKLIAVEAGGRGTGTGEHAARVASSAPVGIAQGYKSYFLQDHDGQLLPTHSVAAGLDYPGIGPQLAALAHTARVAFVTASDSEALAATGQCAKYCGIIPALESAHAVAHAVKLAPTLPKTQNIIVNVSGSGEKDLFIIAREAAGVGIDSGTALSDWKEFLTSELKRVEAAL